ncbi:MAG: metallophosphoesterase family protein [bacterium]|nr:metallophosphoesterase family protein [bacterium]
MKILHYSDKSSPDFLDLYNQCDILVTTGDLTLFDFAGLQDVANKKPALGVYGNHDSGQYLETLGIVNLHNKVYDFNGFKWGGFQSCLKYKESGIMFTEEEAKIFADTFPAVDILLLHAGPLGMLDDPTDRVHIGSENIRKYVLEKQPKVVFCGHQYSNDSTQVDNSIIYRTYRARMI